MHFPYDVPAEAYCAERTRIPEMGTVTAPEGSVKKSLPLSSTTMNACLLYTSDAADE